MINSRRSIILTSIGILLSRTAGAISSLTTQGCPGPNCITGAELIDLNKPMGTGRIYTSSEVQHSINIWRGRRVRGRLVVDNYQSEGSAINRKELTLGESSHVASNLRILGDMLVCDVEILPGPTGEVLTELARLGLADFRTYGIGSTDNTGYVRDFELIRVDVFPTV
jgi:hypothetical protein